MIKLNSKAKSLTKFNLKNATILNFKFLKASEFTKNHKK